MSKEKENESHSFEITMEKTGPMQFTVTFDKPQYPSIKFDEPPRSGGNDEYPNASRYLTAAVMNCLSASLTFCLNKSKVGLAKLKTKGSCTIARDEEGYWRVQKINVTLQPEWGDDIDLKDEHVMQRIKRCVSLFEKYCIVSASVRRGIPIDVNVNIPES